MVRAALQNISARLRETPTRSQPTGRLVGAQPHFPVPSWAVGRRRPAACALGNMPSSVRPPPERLSRRSARCPGELLPAQSRPHMQGMPQMQGLAPMQGMPPLMPLQQPYGMYMTQPAPAPAQAPPGGGADIAYRLLCPSSRIGTRPMPLCARRPDAPMPSPDRARSDLPDDA